MSDSSTVVAFFPSQASAEMAISALEAAGFPKAQIGVAAAEDSTSASSTATPASTAYTAGHTAGQNAEGAWEKVKGFFSGNSAEPYAGEASRETFDDNVITPEGYDPEDLHGSLSDLSVPQEHTRYFGHRLGTAAGGALVTVNAPGREGEAVAILQSNGGDLGDQAADYDYGATTPTQGSAQKIQLYGEVLRVHKDRINRGEVRIRKEVVSTTQTVEVPVTREELVVERVPVSGHVPAPGATFDSEEIRIPLSEERASVSKEAVVREEVRVGKKEVTSVEQLNEQVRSEELKVDQDVRNTTGKTA